MSDARASSQYLSRPPLMDDRHYRRLVDSMADYAIFGLDRQGRITDWNSGAERIKGYRSQDIIGRHFSLFYTPEDQEKGEHSLALAAVARDGRFEGQGWRVRGDGSRFWAEVVIEDILDDHNVPIGYVKVTRDVTDRREVGRALDEANAVLLRMQRREASAQRASDKQSSAFSEAQFRAIFEEAGVGMIQSDAGRIVRVNRALVEMLGYQPDELIGRLAIDLVWPEDRDVHRAERRRISVDQTATLVFETRFARRDGSPIWVRSTVTLIGGGDPGALSPTVEVVENIDERRRAKLALESTAHDLEQALSDRTLALAQRDHLLREVYHRVNNNLQVIDSIMVLQARQLEGPEAKSALHSLRGRIYTLGLVHSKLVGSSNLRTFDMAPILRELSRNLVDGAAVGDVSLSVQASSLVVGLDFAIPVALLATELVTDALKHAFPEGGGRINVSLDQGRDGVLRFVVADNGQGIPLSSQPATGQHGLGHEIVRNLTKQMKGSMVIDGIDGTRVEIIIPHPVPA